MTVNSRQIALDWIPKALLNLLRSRFGSVRYEGDYPSWARAMAHCQGYSSTDILDRVREASLAVQEGRAKFERDSVRFDRVEYAWPVLASLLWVALLRRGKLHVLDFGGSLGTSYRQNRLFLESVDTLRWSIVEQPNFARSGQQLFQDETLRFFSDLDEPFRFGQPDVVLLSGVLPYLEKPFDTLEAILNKKIDFLIIDRSPLIDAPKDRLCIQRTSGRLPKASYPAWFFSRPRFLEFFRGRYDLIEEFDSVDRANIRSRHMGFLFRRVGAT